MYCPECGVRVFHNFPRLKWDNTFSEAWLRVQDYHAAAYGSVDEWIEHDLKQVIIDYHTKEGE
jgi:hypothetical protein